MAILMHHTSVWIVRILLYAFVVGLGFSNTNTVPHISATVVCPTGDHTDSCDEWWRQVAASLGQDPWQWEWTAVRLLWHHNVPLSVSGMPALHFTGDPGPQSKRCQGCRVEKVQTCTCGDRLDRSILFLCFWCQISYDSRSWSVLYKQSPVVKKTLQRCSTELFRL